MGLFHVIEGAQVILRSKGVFRQAKLYERDGRIAAAAAGGYVMLRSEGRTTHPDISWVEIDGALHRPEVSLAGTLVLEAPREQLKIARAK